MNKNYIDKLVSVIVPVYNAEDFMIETLESILSQTYKDIEIICIDDMSKDSSRKIIKEYADKYENVIPLLLTENGGVANARNRGIEKARGRYIAFLDSDDVWEKDKIEKQIKFMQDNKYSFTFTGYRFMDSESRLLNTVVKAKKELSYNDLLKHNAISCLTVVIDRYDIDEIHMPKIHHEDYACWLSILKKGKKAYGLNETLARYRTRQNSLSGNKVKAASWTWNILRKEEKLNIFKASYCFVYYAIVNIFKHFISK